MDDPNITMKEYIRLEEEKALKRGKVFNWEIAKYGKIWYDEDIHDLRSVKTEFPTIAFNDEVSSEKTLSCEPTVSSLNNEIDFRISFEDSDDKDYTVIFDKNSFSYKIISTNDLKTDLEYDNEKVNLPSLLSPEPTVSCFDDLDFFKDFENEFSAIVYNNAQTSELDLLTEPILNPQHIDEFNLKDETSLYECDGEEQNALNFNDLFSFNVIYPNDSKSDKDNDDDKVDIEHSSGDLSIKPLLDVINTDNGRNYQKGIIQNYYDRLEEDVSKLTRMMMEKNKADVVGFKKLEVLEEDVSKLTRMMMEKNKEDLSFRKLEVLEEDVSKLTRMMMEKNKEDVVGFKKLEVLEEDVSKLTRMMMEKNKEDVVGFNKLEIL
ncbi:hypothetical protein Tco_0403347 [Tanacetum coccineum]